jgi:hypothetical protein
MPMSLGKVLRPSLPVSDMLGCGKSDPEYESRLELGALQGSGMPGSAASVPGLSGWAVDSEPVTLSFSGHPEVQVSGCHGQSPVIKVMIRVRGSTAPPAMGIWADLKLAHVPKMSRHRRALTRVVSRA